MTHPRVRAVLDRLPSPDHPVVRFAFGMVIIGLFPIQRVAAIHQGYGIRAWLLIVISAVVCLVLDRVRWATTHLAGPFAVAAGAAVLAAGAGGRIVGILLFATTVFGAWVAFGARLPLLPAFDPRSRLPVAFVAWGASRVALHHTRLLTALLWYGLAVVLALVLADRPELPGRAYRWLVPRLRRLLQVVLLTPLWFVVALLPWVFQRIVRWDPLSIGQRKGSSWVPRRDEAPHPDRLWFTDPQRERPSFGRRLHAKAPFGLAVLLIVGCFAAWVVFTQVLPAIDPPPRNQAEEQLRGEGFDSLRAANDAAVSQIRFSQYAGNEWSDFESEFLNITHGKRATWQPDECPPETLDVWMFGGSTMFGVYERDDQTIPSAVAKEADARGIPLNVTNWGMVGDVSWQEGRRFERALAAGDPPDVVIFYDGWNDLRGVADMDFAGRGGDTDFVGPMDRLQMPVLNDLDGVEPDSTREVHIPPLGPGLPPDEVVDLAARQYRTADRNQRLLAEANGVEMFRFYQPSLHSRYPLVEGEAYSDPPQRELIADFRGRLPGTVRDLGAIFNDSKDPYFYDEVHTNDEANPIIAAAILDEVQPTLERLAATEEDGSCP